MISDRLESQQVYCVINLTIIIVSIPVYLKIELELIPENTTWSELEPCVGPMSAAPWLN